MSVDQILDRFVDRYGEAASVTLLRTLADKSAGGEGYSIRLKRMIDLDGWEVSKAGRVITLDSSDWWGDTSTDDMAENLKEAMDTDILGIREGLVARLGWGTGKVVLGVVEVGTGLIGIVVPEPGTTVAGVVVFSLGANSIADGMTQLAGANNGYGYNLLGEGAAAIGGAVARATGQDEAIGQAVGQGVFAVSSVVLGSVGSIRILRIRGASSVGLGVAGRPGGATIGRVELAYGSARAQDGMTIININNNAGQSILRFVTHDGVLMANARIGRVMDGSRIVEGSRIMRHTSGLDMLKGLLKLAAHGAIKGL